MSEVYWWRAVCGSTQKIILIKERVLQVLDINRRIIMWLISANVFLYFFACVTPTKCTYRHRLNQSSQKYVREIIPLCINSPPNASSLLFFGTHSEKVGKQYVVEICNFVVWQLFVVIFTKTLSNSSDFFIIHDPERWRYF